MSSFLKLNVSDIIKGLIVAVLAAIITGVSASLEAGTLPSLDQLKTIGLTALAAGLAYLCKNFLTNSSGNIATPEQK